MDDLNSEWQRKGATFSDKTARKDFGLTRDDAGRASQSPDLHLARREEMTARDQVQARVSDELVLPQGTIRGKAPLRRPAWNRIGRALHLPRARLRLFQGDLVHVGQRPSA
jgi:hypothetical protein